MPSPFLEELPPETTEVLDETTGTMPTGMDTPFGYTGPGPQRTVDTEVDRETGLAVGEMVRHATFGVGRVVSFHTTGGRRVVVIQFKTVGEKKIVAQYARLVRVAPR
jgi:DNA helicase-2/ATP-dependent DNA helicase PcrA